MATSELAAGGTCCWLTLSCLPRIWTAESTGSLQFSNGWNGRCDEEYARRQRHRVCRHMHLCTHVGASGHARACVCECVPRPRAQGRAQTAGLVTALQGPPQATSGGDHYPRMVPKHATVTNSCPNTMEARTTITPPLTTITTTTTAAAAAAAAPTRIRTTATTTVVL